MIRDWKDWTALLAIMGLCLGLGWGLSTLVDHQRTWAAGTEHGWDQAVTRLTSAVEVYGLCEVHDRMREK